MKNLTEIALKTTAGNPIFDNRVKMTTDEVIEKFPSGISITECALLTNDKGEYAVITFAEEPDVFVTCGTILTNIVREWVAAIGTIEEVNGMLIEQPVRVKLHKILNKKKQPLTVVDVLPLTVVDNL